MAAISVDNISKNYGATAALKSVSFEVGDGELFGLIGPDGAGKSTLFRILTTLLLPDEGVATVVGHDIIDSYKLIRKEVGYMPGKFSLYQDLTVEENLSFFATIFGTSIDENYDLIKDIYIQIEPFKKRLAGKLSGGMKQKLALCCALIHKPRVLFLDEPTTGVDAVSRKEFWDMLKTLVKKDISILVSTPYMDEASLCDRIALIQNGEILSIDAPNAMINGYDKHVYSVKSLKFYELLELLRTLDFTISALPFGDCLHLTTGDELDVAATLTLLSYKGFSKVEITKIPPTVEDIFLALSEHQTEKSHG
jgi:ABC-2 type transport system ATP-binding protein